MIPPNQWGVHKRQLIFWQRSRSRLELYIGGYQPAQKWLKDRKDENYPWGHSALPKIIVALSETYRIMMKLIPLRWMDEEEEKKDKIG
jgi:hypothetical protein